MLGSNPGWQAQAVGAVVDHVGEAGDLEAEGIFMRDWSTCTSAPWAMVPPKGPSCGPCRGRCGSSSRRRQARELVDQRLVLTTSLLHAVALADQRAQGSLVGDRHLGHRNRRRLEGGFGGRRVEGRLGQVLSTP